MIVYQSTKKEFLKDSSSNIEDIIQQYIHKKLKRTSSVSEYNSWKNSLGNAMHHLLNTDKIPDDAGVAIEYVLPSSSKRIDFLITGEDDTGKENIVIIELKQWTDIEITDQDGLVKTYFGRRPSLETHPSYQAWSYSAFLYGFSTTVYEDGISLEPCAYLHNYQDKNIITNAFYNDYIEKAPPFFKGDKEKLQNFIAKYVRKASKRNILYCIDKGKIRPSKYLADSLVSMIKGNQEFIMIDDQKIVYETALSLSKKSSENNKNVLIVEGGPGTGKSVVAVNLLVAITKLGLNTRYVTKNSAPRKVFESKLYQPDGLKRVEISNMFTGSGSYVKCEPNLFDALIVDESHRLNEKSGMMKNSGENQIKEIIEASKCSIFFIDQDQRVTWSDIGTVDEIKKWASKLNVATHYLKLESQFRCNGSDGYPSWLDNTLQIRETANKTLDNINYDFQIIESPSELHKLIIEKNKINNKSRMVAGYCWDWISKTNDNEKDIVISEYNFKAKWNLTSDGSAWIIAPKSVNEIGCIHTCQGLEVDYIGVIIGSDIGFKDGKIITYPNRRANTDKSLFGYKKAFSNNPTEAYKKADLIIKNTYKTLMTRGMKGCYVYFVDKELEAFFKFCMSNKIQETNNKIKDQFLEDVLTDGSAKNGYVPIYNLKAAATSFKDQTKPEVIGWKNIGNKATENMFIAQVVGKSMEPKIKDGSWCLFRLPKGGTRNGLIVLAESRKISDPETQSSFTIKTYHSEKEFYGNDQWKHTKIILSPINKDFKDIVLEEVENEEFRIVAEFIAVL